MAVSDQSTGDTLLLDAALESIPYGFCVWSPQFELVMWNRHYLDLYGFPAKRDLPGHEPRGGGRAQRARWATIPARPPDEFLEAYRAELLANRGGARAKSREMLAGGRTIETAHVYLARPRLGGDP